MLIIPILPLRGDYSVIASPDGKPVSGLIANIDLELVESGFPNRLTLFRIDPGASCSAMSLKAAEKLGIVQDDDRTVNLKSRTASTKLTSQKVRIGKLVARIAKLRSEPFTWPIIFHPDWPESNPRLLGLAGVVSDLTMTFNGTPTANSRYGAVMISLRSSDATGT